MLWVDKYRPQSGAEVAANNHQVRAISSWLSGWQSPHFIDDASYPRSMLNEK
jgi:hypothetical protein